MATRAGTLPPPPSPVQTSGRSSAVRAGRPRLSALGLIAACCLLSQARPAAGESDPHGLIQGLSLLVGAESVFVELRPVAGSGQPRLLAELRGPEGLLKARGSAVAAGDGSVELRLTRGGLDAAPAGLLPGDLLRLQAEYTDGRSGGRELLVPRLGVGLAPVDRRLTGWAPPGETVLVITADARGGFGSDAAVAAADGRWQLHLDEDLDLGPGAGGTVLYTDRSGAVFQAAWSSLALKLEAGAPEIDLHLRPGEHGRLAVWGTDGRLRARGEVRGAGSPVRLLLRDAAGLLTGPRPGDTLRWTFESAAPEVHPPRPALEIPWPDLDIAIDEGAASAQGQAPPGTRLGLQPEGRPLLRREVVADAAGRWRVDWRGSSELGPRQGLALDWPDNPGLSLLARAAQLEAVDPAWAEAKGRGVAGEDVTARLLDAQGGLLAERRTTVNADGRFALSLRQADLLTDEASVADAAEALPLAPGQRLQLLLAGREGAESLLGEASRLDLAPAADADSERLSLPLPGSYRLRARLAGQETWLEAEPADDQVPVVDFSQQGGLLPGSEVELSVMDDRGLDRGLRFPVFRLSAFQDGGWILVEGPPGLQVPLEQERAGATVARGDCTVDHTRRCTAWLRDAAGGPQDLRPGDTLLAFPEGAASASLELVKLTAHIDPSGRDVTGQAPSGRPVDIAFSGLTGAAWPSNTRSATDPMGVYDYELNSSQWDLLLPGLVADVFLEASSGHRNAARGLLERLQVRWDGQGGPYPGTIAAMVEVASAYSVERFAAHDLDAAGQPLPGRTAAAGLQSLDQGTGDNTLPQAATADLLVLGDLLRLGHRRGQRSMLLAPLAAWLLDDAGTVAGLTAPFLPVRAVYRLAGDEGDADRRIAIGQADADGHFTLTPPPLSLRDIAEIQVLADSGQGELRRSLLLRLGTQTGVGGSGARHRAYLPLAEGLVR